MEKKKGSTMILVLTIGFVMILLSGTLMSSLLYTTKGNKETKEDTDIFYAAESGIEYGEASLDSNLVNNIMTTGSWALPSIEYEYGTVKRIDMTFEKLEDKKIELKSIATGHTGKSRTIKTYYKIEPNSKPPIGGANNILENGLIANTVDVGVSPCNNGVHKHNFDMETSKVTSGDMIFPECATLPTKKPVVKVEGPIFYDKNNPNEFGGYIDKVDKVEINYISERVGFGGINLYSLAKDKILDKSGYSKYDGGIARVEDTQSVPVLNNNFGEYDITLVNADQLIIKPISPNQIDDTHRIIICSGDIIVETDEVQTKLHLSTLYGKSITIKSPSAFHQSFAPRFGEDGKVDAASLTDSQINSIDSIVSKYVKNWNSAITEPGEGDGTASGQWTKLEDETIYE